MPNPDTEILQSLERRAKRVSSGRLYERGQRRWVPNSDRIVNPLAEAYWQGVDVMEGSSRVRVLDLRALNPEDLVVFSTSVVSYILKMEEREQVTAWINTVYGGLTAGRDEVKTVALARKRVKELDKRFDGGLIVNGVRRMRTRIAMPYFSFDSSTPERVKPPREAWIDTVTGIWVRTTRSQ
jgi:hypothetical protein